MRVRVPLRLQGTAIAVALPTARARWQSFADAYRPALELSAVALCGVLHMSWSFVEVSRAFLVIPMVLGWLGYIVSRVRADPDVVKRWGLGVDGLGPASLMVAGCMAVSVPIMVALGWAQGHGLPPATWLVAWCLYPIWGLVQQFLVQCLVTGNWVRLPGRWGHPAVATVVSATLFGLVHSFDPPLVPATFLLGLVLAPLWLKYRSLWPLAIAHGWLGTVMYYVVLGREPLATYVVW